MIECGGNGLILLVPDVVFQRTHRKFEVISNETRFKHGDTKDFVAALPTLLLHIISLLLNGYLLYLNIRGVDRRRCKRLPLLIANFAICNMFLLIGFIFYILTIDVIYRIENIEAISSHNPMDAIGSTFYSTLKEILKIQIVQNFGNIQILFVLFICADRYYSLFFDHEPNYQSVISATIHLSLPYILSIIFLDVRLLQLYLTATVIIIICLVVLVLIPSLALVLVICTLIRQYHLKAPFRIRNRSLTITLLLIVIIEQFEKWGLAMELMEANFCVEIVIGNLSGDHNLRVTLDNWYELVHGIQQLMPFISVILLLVLVRSYREQAVEHIRQSWNWIRCQERDTKVDYKSETMRSIIAEQTQTRRYRNYTSTIEIF